jgi:hypothetical protein
LVSIYLSEKRFFPIFAEVFEDKAKTLTIEDIFSYVYLKLIEFSEKQFRLSGVYHVAEAELIRDG